MIKVFFKHIFIRIHVHAYIYLYKMGKSQLSKNKLFVCFLSNVKILFGIWSGRLVYNSDSTSPFFGKVKFWERQFGLSQKREMCCPNHKQTATPNPEQI